MRLKKGFVTHEIANEQVMVAVGEEVRTFHGLVRSNKTAAFIINCLKQECTREELINKMLEEYDVSREVVENDIVYVLSELNRIGALDERKL